MANAHPTNPPTHREDIAAYFASCSDAFGRLAALAKTIEAQAPNCSDLKKLAGAAYYIANDFENTANCWRDDVSTYGVRND